MQTQTNENTMSIIEWYVEEIRNTLDERPDKGKNFLKTLKENPEVVQEEIRASAEVSVERALNSGKVKGFCNNLLDPGRFAENIMKALKGELLSN